MPNKIRNFLVGTTTVFIIAAPVAASAQTNPTTTPAPPTNDPNTSLTVEQVSPDIVRGLCQGINLQVGTDCSQTELSDEEATERVNALIRTIINIFSLVVGVVAVIMIIIGGLKYITSGGDSSNVTGAKNTILYAIIGLVIVALSQVIVRFVLSRVTQ